MWPSLQQDKRSACLPRAQSWENRDAGSSAGCRTTPERRDPPTVCGCSVAHHRAQGPTPGRQLRMEEQAGPLFCLSVCPALRATVQGQHPHPVGPRPAPTWEDPQGQGWVDAERGHRGECGENQLSLPPANSSLRCSGRWKRKQEDRDSMTLLAFQPGGGGVG